MNRKEAYFKFSKILSIDNDSKESYVNKSKYKDLINQIYDDFEKDLKEINNQVSRLKKQLANNHHVECMCSFCNPLGEEKDCDSCLNIQGISDCCQYCIRGEGFSKDYWELKC